MWNILLFVVCFFFSLRTEISMNAIYQCVASKWLIQSMASNEIPQENSAIYYEWDKMEMIFEQATEILRVIDRIIVGQIESKYRDYRKQCWKGCFCRSIESEQVTKAGTWCYVNDENESKVKLIFFFIFSLWQIHSVYSFFLLHSLMITKKKRFFWFAGTYFDVQWTVPKCEKSLFSQSHSNHLLI